MLEFEISETKAKMQSLAFENYTTFIASSDTVHSIEEEVLRIDNRLETMSANLNELSTACENFSATWARDLNAKRNANKVQPTFSLLGHSETPQ